MAFKIICDREHSSIVITKESPDNYEVFATFQEAKNSLRGYLVKKRTALTTAIIFVRRLKIEDLENEH